MQRLIALFIVVLPGLLAVGGIKWMRDSVFGITEPFFPSLLFQFLTGFLSFIFGLGFVGGFIFYRDRKRNKVQKKFQKKKPLP